MSDVTTAGLEPAPAPTASEPVLQIDDVAHRVSPSPLDGPCCGRSLV